jgi:PqqD family protein of HPr-rel-A system
MASSQGLDTCRLRARRALIWREWENEHAIYNPASGDLHLLDEVGAKALHCLESQALSQAELVCRLGTELEVASDDNLVKYVRELLREFDRLGLVERL